TAGKWAIIAPVPEQITLLTNRVITPVRDYFLWSLFNTIYMNACCLGFLGLIFAMKARDRIVIRDTEGARSYSTIAKRLNIAATVLTLVFYHQRAGEESKENCTM
uniref:Uncharacterized protein n=1 Tax=Callorhinchus milii TaxID=7868 RepID=A0A4W3HQD5_CALMI